MHMTIVKRAVAFALAASMNSYPLPSSAAESNTANIAVRDGCLNQWMFDGVWRVRATAFARHVVGGQQTGWDVTEQWRNGTDQTLAPGTGTFALSQQLEFQKGDKTGALDSTTGTLSQQDVDYHDFPPSAQYTHVQVFLTTNVDPNDKPAAVIVAFDAAKLSQVANRPHFSVSPPNYRIKFACTPSELAHATAQGGSQEVAAHEGCLNTWISDGMWRVQVVKLSPDLDTSSNQQLGWAVTENWTNSTKRSMTPNDSFVLDQQLVLSNGDTISSSNSTVTTLTAQKLDYRAFAPGSSYTHVQLFRNSQETYDAANKPVKLLLLFDVKALANATNGPKYSPPTPNIRIKLECPN
ncbi:MAG TPA: hypothetical protein VII69_04000 [Candidatus Eremiobacteraceae bacterium]